MLSMENTDNTQLNNADVALKSDDGSTEVENGVIKDDQVAISTENDTKKDVDGTPSYDNPQFEMINVDEQGEPSIVEVNADAFRDDEVLPQPSTQPEEISEVVSESPLIVVEQSQENATSGNAEEQSVKSTKKTTRKRTTRKSSTKKRTSTKKYHSIEELERLPEKEYSKTVGKQMFMTHVLGVKPELSEMDKRQKLFKRIFTISFLVIMFGVIAYTFYTDFFAPGSHREETSLSGFFENVAQNWYHLIFALLSLAVCYLAKGFKLSLMCKSMTGKWQFRTCMQTGIIGHYYNNVTPLGAGGQPFEIYHLSKNGVHGGTASSLPIAAFFMFQLAFVVLGIFNVTCFTAGTNIFNLPDSILGSTTADVLRPLAIVGLILGLLMPGLVIVFSLLPRLCSKLVYFVISIGNKLKLVKDPKLTTRKTLKTVISNSKCLKSMASSPLVFTMTFLISLVEVLAIDSIAFFTLKFFGYSNPDVNFFVEWCQIIQVCSILYAAISFIPTPGNSGAADFSFYWLFQTGLLAGFAFPAMIIWRFLSYYSFIIIGIIFLSVNKRREQKKKEMEL